MPYITIPLKQKQHKISMEDLFFGVESLFDLNARDTYDTLTVYKKVTPPSLTEKLQVEKLVVFLKDFNQKHSSLFEADKKSLYYKFSIPKKKGGYREICAPNDALKEALRELKSIFEYQFHVKYHTSAFAYIKNRRCMDVAKRHQKNESKWFATFDFKDFFGSISIDFLMQQFSLIYPFSEICKNEEYKTILQHTMSLCFLNGGLPQGTPISPMLTNIIMIPIDHLISREIRALNKRFVYTRYCDDIQISSRFDFKPQEIQTLIEGVLERFNAPIKIKPEKTKYTAIHGRNWILGVMLNKDNQVTIGHTNKKTFKNGLNNLFRDYAAGIKWDPNDVQIFAGHKAYYESIEPEAIKAIVEKYEERFNLKLKSVIKDCLNINAKIFI